MLQESVKIDEAYIQAIEEETQEAFPKRQALVFFSNRTKLESLRFFIV